MLHRPRRSARPATMVVLAAALLGPAPLSGQGDAEAEAVAPPSVEASRTDAFVLRQSVTLPGSPDSVWSVVTGDIEPWWDHHVTEDPHRFYIEPEPGGCFCEIFDESGDGVQHARVTFARRGDRLILEGPLGLMGNALHMVTTYRLEARGDSTRLSVEIHGAGEVREGWPETIARVWRHFLHERLKPYMEGRLEG